MLREVKDGAWVRQGLWFAPRYAFAAGRRRQARGISRRRLQAMDAAQQRTAVPIAAGDHGRAYWWCLDRFFTADEALTAADVHALAYERAQRVERRLEHAHAVVAAGAGDHPSASRREVVPRAVRYAVWARDGGACTACEATFDLQFDHVIPVARGGASTEANLQLLCGDCNRRKGASLG
jgi:5-methylcytosine-specific restriction endonuclease McrA